MKVPIGVQVAAVAFLFSTIVVMALLHMWGPVVGGRFYFAYSVHRVLVNSGVNYRERFSKSQVVVMAGLLPSAVLLREALLSAGERHRIALVSLVVLLTIHWAYSAWLIRRQGWSLGRDRTATEP